MEFINVCFSKDGKYCTLIKEGKVMVFDCSALNSDIPIISVTIPKISGAIYDGNELYLSIKESNKIYCWKNNVLELFKELDESMRLVLPIRRRDILYVELVLPVKGTDKWVVRVNERLMLYAPKENKILYSLSLQSDFRDYALCNEDNIAILLAGTSYDVSVYEGDGDIYYAEMAMCNFSTGVGIDVLGTTSIDDSWDGYRKYYPREGKKYKWPLIQYSNHIPTPMVCSENARNVLYLGNGYYYIADALTGEMLRILENKIFIKLANAIFVDKELKKIVVVLNDRIQIYKISEIPQKELKELNQIYPLLNRMDRRYGSKERGEYEEKFNRMRYIYGDLKLITEKIF